ncbi:hypothetical protein EXU57_19125 [Segetibacter sp. 3557_3]|uniref:hypothetical protein n=1 Tax=Segetibacter sp. 3557_3 TaxID=2547429 RepID=UPI001058F1EB|nr:hypothetical protein [Segetibacter sp. 3557_3]TDH21617.1 hypothetical protein EXU57_19125 [Segetibacter sp. 3557_3]
MKTSNKLLLGVIATCFIVPLVLAMSLKHKVDKNEFTQHKSNSNAAGSIRTGTFSAFKVVKVTAPHPELLRCNLKLSETMQYKYHKGGSKDSVAVFTTNDTLFVNYIVHNNGSTGNTNNDGENFQVTVSVPSVSSIVIDGAVVILDSLPVTAEPLSISVRNNGILRDGTKVKKDHAKVVAPTPQQQVKNIQVAQYTTMTTNANTSANKAVQKTQGSSQEISMKYFVISGIVL